MVLYLFDHYLVSQIMMIYSRLLHNFYPEAFTSKDEVATGLGSDPLKSSYFYLRLICLRWAVDIITTSFDSLFQPNIPLASKLAQPLLPTAQVFTVTLASIHDCVIPNAQEQEELRKKIFDAACQDTELLLNKQETIALVVDDDPVEHSD